RCVFLSGIVAVSHHQLCRSTHLSILVVSWRHYGESPFSISRKSSKAKTARKAVANAVWKNGTSDGRDKPGNSYTATKRPTSGVDEMRHGRRRPDRVDQRDKSLHKPDGRSDAIYV